jgi:hypothetical protein
MYPVCTGATANNALEPAALGGGASFERSYAAAQRDALCERYALSRLR